MDPQGALLAGNQCAERLFKLSIFTVKQNTHIISPKGNFICYYSINQRPTQGLSAFPFGEGGSPKG
jgi:hypothetical protein